MALTRPTLAALALLALALTPVARATAPATTPEIVVYKHGLADPPAQTRKRERDLGFHASQRFRFALGGFAARLSTQQADALRGDPDVAAVVPDRPVHADSQALAPGEFVPTGVRRIGAASGGNVRQASGVGVAVIDTGVDLANPDLNVAPGTNCVDSTKPPQDDNGHGTHVAGTIAARNDGEGLVGVAPGTQLYAVKVLGADGSGSTSSVICGLDWVAGHAADLNIRVANMSLGGPGSVGTCASDPEHAAICAVTAAGVTVVAAAGNNGAQISSSGSGHVPAGYPEVLAVTAMADTDGAPGGLGPGCDQTVDDSFEPFSNYPGPDDLSHTIAAPGGCILSLAPSGGTATMSGTSMASPHVAGAAALCIDEAGTGGPCAGLPPSGVIAELLSVAQNGATMANGFTGDSLHPAAHDFGSLVRASTPPNATTGAASAIGDHGATLAGTVNAHGSHASWWFELGTDGASYDLTTPAQAGDPGDADSAVQASATGLDGGTAYHYRAVVDVDGWIIKGADQTFTTTGTPPPPPPDTVIDSAPASVIPTSSVQIAFSGSPAADTTGFQCHLDTDPWAPCSSPYSNAFVSDGGHTFYVRALGSGGKPDPTPASTSWTVHTQAPDTRIGGHPSDPTTSTSATIGISSTVSSATFECRLDAEAWSPCSSVWQRSALAPGTHHFEARATDQYGLTDPTPATADWTIVAPAAGPGSSSQPTGVPGMSFASPPPGPTQPRGLLAVGSARVRHRIATIRLACAAVAPCIGTLEFRAARVRLALRAVHLRAGRHSIWRLWLPARFAKAPPATLAVTLVGGQVTRLRANRITVLT